MEQDVKPDELRRLSDAATTGEWGVGTWTGQCHKHEPGQHPGEPRCKYDYEVRPEGDDSWDGHDIIALAKPGVSIAGNYDCEVGGIVMREDRDFIVALVNAYRSGALIVKEPTNER